MTGQYDYLIVGGGLSGAVFAQEATRHGKRVLVVDRRNHTGGNLYCLEIEGIKIHRYGAHIFHTSNRMVWDYINQFVAFNHYVNSPLANYQGEIYNMPFNMNTFSRMWGISTPDQAEAVIAAQKKEISGVPQNLEEQAISLVGRDIYEKLIRGYTEKQWGKPCDKLPPSIIRRIPVRFTYDNNYFNDCYQGIPLEGYNELVRRLLKGSEVRLNCDFLQQRSALSALANKIVYTGMLDEYFGYEHGALEYRSLRFEDEVLDIPNYQGVAVVNYTDSQTPYTRIIEHKHFEFGDQPHTVITREYPMNWKPGLEAYYPIDSAPNRAILKKYQAMASREPGVLFCGRLAEYKYYDMDQAIASILERTKREFGV